MIPLQLFLLFGMRITASIFFFPMEHTDSGKHCIVVSYMSIETYILDVKGYVRIRALLVEFRVDIKIPRISLLDHDLVRQSMSGKCYLTGCPFFPF